MSAVRCKGEILREGEPVIVDVDFTVGFGECVGVIGPNGSGKSSLLLGLRGQLAVNGQHTIDEVDASRLSRREIARHIAVVPQRTEFSFPYTVEEMVLFGRAPHRRPWEPFDLADRGHVDRALHRLGLSDLRSRPVDTISGGERRKVFLARALVQETPYLFLDEPTLGLDARAQEELFSIVGELGDERGRGIVVVLHDLRHGARLCDRLVGLRAGRQVLSDSTDRVLASAVLEDLFGLPWQILVDADGRSVPIPAPRGNETRAPDRRSDAP